MTEKSTNTAEAIVLRHTMASAGTGLLPFPLLDIAAMIGVNLNLVRALAAHYEVSFREEAARSAIIALLAGAGLPALVGPTISLLKLVPGAGYALGGLVVPGLSGALTYAVGKVFVQHFESGGTLLDFDASRFRDLFRREVENGKAEQAEQAEQPA